MMDSDIYFFKEIGSNVDSYKEYFEPSMIFNFDCAGLTSVRKELLGPEGSILARVSRVT